VVDRRDEVADVGGAENHKQPGLGHVRPHVLFVVVAVVGGWGGGALGRGGIVVVDNTIITLLNRLGRPKRQQRARLGRLACHG